jgi:hypothetical protein
MLVDSIHVEGYPPFKMKDPDTKKLVRNTNIKDIENKGRRFEKILKSHDKEFIKMLFNGLLFTSKIRPSEREFDNYIAEAFHQRNYTDVIKA